MRRFAPAALITALAATLSSQAVAAPRQAAQDCVPINQIRSTRVIDDRNIDFEMSGGRVLRNRLPQACSGLGFERRFSYRTSLSRLCSLDIINVLDSNGRPGASCGLGRFVPVGPTR